MSSYNENISRLKESSRRLSAQKQEFNLDRAKMDSDSARRHAEQVATSLSSFSESLHNWKVKDIKEKTAQGVVEAKKARLDKAKTLTAHAAKLAEIDAARGQQALLDEFDSVKAQDTAYQEIKAEMLRASGPTAYPDADRIANLSPWQQVGYSKEKLRAFNESFPDKLSHAMQNSEKAITIAGVTFTPKEIHENNIQGLPFKEAAIQVLSDDIRKAAQVDRFSPEMLALAGTDEAAQKAQDNLMSKYRTRYNIDASQNTRGKAYVEWQNSEKNGDDLARYLLITSNTIDKSGNILGNTGGLDTVFSQLTQEGVNLDSTAVADKYAALPMPDSLADKLGAKRGTTFGQQWPQRFRKMKLAIKEGTIKKINNEQKELKAAGTKLENDFIKEAREGTLSTARVNWYKRQFGDLGLPIPSDVEKYETASMRDEREDKQQIEALMASNDGFISHDQLDSFHPLAALEFREKATKMQEKAIKAHDSEAKIKSYLDTAFTNMGIKANEKSPAYVEAMSNAKVDYAEKYNRYIAMNYSSAEASRLALHADQVKDKETGEVIPDSMGVLTEIEKYGEKSKYVIEGQAIEKTMKAGHLRVARVASGKREMLDDPDIIFNGTIGGDYGHRQLTSVKNNIDKYGARKGVRMDKGAIQYYKGLARGRDDNWMGLLDKQLKATGHPGLWEEERPAAVDLLSGENGKGEKLDDPNNLVGLTKSANQAFNYPSANSYVYGMNQLKEGELYGKTVVSVWDSPLQLGGV